MQHVAREAAETTGSDLKKAGETNICTRSVHDIPKQLTQEEVRFFSSSLENWANNRFNKCDRCGQPDCAFSYKYSTDYEAGYKFNTERVIEVITARYDRRAKSIGKDGDVGCLNYCLTGTGGPRGKQDNLSRGFTTLPYAELQRRNTKKDGR